MNIKYNGFYHKYFLFKSHNIRSFCGVFWTTLFALFLYFVALNSAVSVVVFPFLADVGEFLNNKNYTVSGITAWFALFFMTGMLALLIATCVGIGITIAWTIDYIRARRGKKDGVVSVVMDSVPVQFVGNAYDQFKTKTCKMVNFTHED